MNSNILPNFILIITAATLIGCGESDLQIDTSTPSHRFKIENHTWSISIPQNWKTIAPPEKNIIWNAQNLDESFIIMSRKGSSKNYDELIEEAKLQFFSFEILSQNNDYFSFRGKINSQTPERIFWQKTESIPGSNYFLIGNCSHEVITNKVSSCEAIIANWFRENAST